MGRMGQTRDNGTGKQFGSHVDYVVEGALPSNSQIVVCDGDTIRGSLTTIPVRASEMLPRPRGVPHDGWGAELDDPRWLDALLHWVPLIRVGQCRNSWGKARDYPSYESTIDYLYEIPQPIIRLAGWYVEWCLEASGRMKDLPPRLRTELLSVKAEYPILSAIFHHVQSVRAERFAENALERLAEFSEDDSPMVRQSAVSAAARLLDLHDKKLDREAMAAPQNATGGNFTLNINIAQMLGKAAVAGGGDVCVSGEIINSEAGG